MTTPITTAPPTASQLAEIRARREAINDTPWGSYRDLGGEHTVEAGAKLTLDEGFSSTDVVARVLGDTDEQRYRRANFIAQAPHDIDRLHNEIDRLRVELAEVRADATAKIREAAELAHAARDERNQLRTRLSAVLDLCDREQRHAMRWEEPLPVPEWVASVQRAALGDDKRDAQQGGESR
jgi:hypothetical protein